MAAEMETESYLEVYEVAKKESVAKTPLAKVRFIPRSGERLFLALEPGKWMSYTVVDVQYFLGYESSTGKPSRSGSKGFGRITLYVEPSK